jgi:hypothetical protein
VFFTEWVNIPIIVIGAVHLDMGADQFFFRATLLRAITWHWLTGIIYPMIKPTPALAYFLASAIDVYNFHVLPPF